MDSGLGANADAVLDTGPCLIEIPAGCGKTELLAAIARRAADSGRRSLILTHTHAGVDVLRKRLQQFDVQRDSAAVFTIAGWARRLVEHFPRLSRVVTGFDPGREDWDEVYRGAGRALTHSHIKSLVTDTYSLLLVDEFQDCTVDQGVIVAQLTRIVPTIVVGDRLQGIFDFGGQRLADWEDLELPWYEMDFAPWRWQGRNEDLGDWLLEQRQVLLDGGSIDLTRAPVEWIEDVPSNRPRVLHRLANGHGDVAVLDGVRNQRVATAKRLGGRFGMMEELEGNVMLALADEFDSGDGFRAGLAVIAFVKDSHANVPATYTNKAAALGRGELPRYRDTACRPALDALVGLVENPSPATLVQALEAAAELPDTTLVCREAWNDALRAARWTQERTDSEPIAFRDCIVKLRDRIRIVGRRPESRTVSSTLLLKGLEYDRCAVLAAHTLDSRNLYVAMTRARDKLIIMSESRRLHPRR